MSRSALAVTVVLAALGALTWFLARDRDHPKAAAGTSNKVEAADVAPGGDEPVQVPAPRAAAAPGSPPRVSTRAELAAVLKARGLDADRLIARYHDWRVAHGFLGADPLTGITAESASSQVYATMDRASLQALADSGDLGAIQAYAAGSLPADPFTALRYYGRASELGSAAAMVEIAAILSDLGNLQSVPGQNARLAGDKLLALRGGNPNRDLRQDSLAWTLASIRQYGPILATPISMERVGELGADPDAADSLGICGQSLAILASLSAATAGKDNAALPPVFVAEKDVYDRLPCRDTPAPVTPPRALEACTSSPAIGGNDQPIELWICPEN